MMHLVAAKRETSYPYWEAVRKHREQLGLSVEDFAHIVRLTASYLYRIEKGGVANPSYETVRALARALGISADELMGEVSADGPEVGGPETLPNDPRVEGVVADVLALGELNPDTLAQLAPIIRATVEKAERDAAEEKRVRRAERRRAEQAGGADTKT
jgi:transcriptional regulator with XRE-family HTH domain